MSAIRKYLQQYAEAEIRLLTDLPPFSVDHCLVIPARNESCDFIQRFFDLAASYTANCLLILVVNRPDTQTDNQENLALEQQALTFFGSALWQNGNLSLYQQHNCYLFLVDRHKAHPIPPKQGVGLARKIASDMACELYQQKKLTKQWVYSTDADAYLPSNYFSSAATTDKNNSALVFSFEHTNKVEPQPTVACWHATQLYEQALKYFHRALQWSGSPYAFYTLGSTLAFSIEHYCQARGFPKRAGGEDFYLLNKLAKLGQVEFCGNISVKIAARESNRVPFGTGPAVAKIMALDPDRQEYCYYNAAIYPYLRSLLESIEKMWAALRNGNDPLQTLPNILRMPLKQLGIDKFFTHSQSHCSSLTAFETQFHQWFDAFLTLKLIHALQETTFPPQPLQSAIEEFQSIQESSL
ncbi:hypothetical protein [Teredinibacter franksiae]|uniref:hypothetical protein n=1 Tax=Teredinibacter franksiae TaxID=2761453 RepID=UPI00162A8933|nr:hypothetical protein [Teredinibacter franksiae]